MNNAIQISKTSEEFRKGFIFAVTAIADMVRGEKYTMLDFIKQLDDIIKLNEVCSFFPSKVSDHD